MAAVRGVVADNAPSEKELYGIAGTGINRRSIPSPVRLHSAQHSLPPTELHYLGAIAAQTTLATSQSMRVYNGEIRVS